MPDETAKEGGNMNKIIIGLGALANVAIVAPLCVIAANSNESKGNKVAHFYNSNHPDKTYLDVIDFAAKHNVISIVKGISEVFVIYRD